MRLDLHLFQVGELRLCFAPITDSLAVVDEVGWDALASAAAGHSRDEIRRSITRRHGSEAAGRCLDELAALIAAHGLADPDPLSEAAGPRPDPSRPDGSLLRDWLPSSPDRPVLKSLCLNVAHDCDLACRYCFAGQGRFGASRGLMGLDVARAAVDFLLANSEATPTCDIDFFGGEPLLNLNVVRETVDYVRSRERATGRRVGLTLTTNAVSLGPDESRYLNETMDNVILSLDGRPEVHDRMRPSVGGRPSQVPVLENIKGFVALRGTKDYWVRGTYTAFNLDFAEDAIYLAHHGLRNLSLEPAVGGSAGAGRWGLDPSHLPRLRAEYLRLADFIFEETVAGRTLNFFHFIAEADAGPCYAKRVRGCGAGREYMAVTPNGDLYPCHQFVGKEGFLLGNVRDGLLTPAGRTGSAPRAAVAPLDAEGPTPRAAAGDVGRLWLGAKPACRSCWARYRCSGGCHANGYAATGSLLEPDPFGCALLKARLEAGLYLQARRALAKG